MQKFVLIALALALLLAFLLWPRSESRQDLVDSLLESGYTYAEAERLADEDFKIDDLAQPSADTPLTLRLPEATDPPDKVVANLLLEDPAFVCQENADSGCRENIRLPSGYFLWARVDDIFRERDQSVEVVSWQCLRNKKGQFMVRGPLFSELSLREEQWSVERILDPVGNNLSDSEKKSIRFVRGQLPLECGKR